MSKNLAVPNHLLKMFGAAGVEINNSALSAADHIQEGIKHKQKSILGTIAAGWHFSEARESDGNGFISSEAMRQGTSRMSIYRDIAIYELFKRSPSECVTALLQLDTTKLLHFKNLESKEIKALTSGKEVHGITYDEVIDISSRELERRLKESQRSNNELEQALDKVNQENVKLQEQIKLNRKKQNSLEGFNYPLSVERVRIESSVLSAQIVQSIDDMEQLAVELTQASDLSKEKKKQEAEFSAGASSLYLNLKAVHSKSAYLMKWFAETFGEDYLPDKPEDVPSMTLEEAEKVHSLHRLLLAEARLDRDSRESQRKTKRKKAKK